MVDKVTQIEARRQEHRRRGDAARLLAEEAIADIDEALRVGAITEAQANVAMRATIVEFPGQHVPDPDDIPPLPPAA